MADIEVSWDSATALFVTVCNWLVGLWTTLFTVFRYIFKDLGPLVPVVALTVLLSILFAFAFALQSLTGGKAGMPGFLVLLFLFVVLYFGLFIYQLRAYTSVSEAAASFSTDASIELWVLVFMVISVLGTGLVVFWHWAAAAINVILLFLALGIQTWATSW